MHRFSSKLEHLFQCSCENLMFYLGLICLFTSILMLEILVYDGWAKFSVIWRITANNLVSWLRFSWSRSPEKKKKKNLSLIFCNALNAELTAGQERQNSKQVLKTKILFNYITCYSDTRGNPKFFPDISFRWFDMVQCVT